MKPGAMAGEAEIIDHVGRVLGAFKKPRKIVFVADMPRAATGKADKKKIKELYEE